VQVRVHDEVMLAIVGQKPPIVYFIVPKPLFVDGELIEIACPIEVLVGNFFGLRQCLTGKEKKKKFKTHFHFSVEAIVRQKQKKALR
jgi:hypothetical protein